MHVARPAFSPAARSAGNLGPVRPLLAVLVGFSALILLLFASMASAQTDTEAPVVVVPADITVPTDPGVATAVVTYAAPTATDDNAVVSGPTLVAGLASGATFPLGATTVTFEATDAAGNTGSGSFTVTVEDTEAPVIRPVGDLTLDADSGGTRLIGFNTIVDDNVDTGIVPVFSLNGAVITSPYAFPLGANVVTISATDLAGNAATEEEFTLTITQGSIPDTPVITTAAINGNRSITIGGSADAGLTVRVTFPDGSVQEATVAAGTFSITSTADMTGGTVSVSAEDDSGTLSAPATVELFPDYDAPVVAITGAPPQITDTTPFPVTITFSEAVSGFEEPDLTVTGGTISGFAGTAAAYTAELTPLGGEDVAISVAAAVAEDAFSNPNDASAVTTVSFVAPAAPSTPTAIPLLPWWGVWLTGLGLAAVARRALR